MARNRGAGSIIQRKDGRWQASLQVNGIRKTVYGSTKRQAFERLQELRDQAVKTGALPDAGRKTVNDLIDRWLETSTPNLKPRTLETYAQTARLYVRPTLGKVRLDKLTPDRIQQTYTQLQKRGLGRAPSKAHRLLHRALKLAVLWGWIASNPCERVVSPRYQAERKRVWTPFELNAFLTRAKEHWLYPLWVLALTSGCRPGELRALSWDDVDWDKATIRIGKTLHRIEGEWVITRPKTQSGLRDVALPSEGMAALRQQEAQQQKWQAKDSWHDTGLVFTQWDGSPLHGATVSHGLKAVCESLNLTPLTPHGLRHLHASLLLQEGLPVPVVSARLGHAGPNITMAVYAHVVGNQDKAAAQAIGAAIAPRAAIAK